MSDFKPGEIIDITTRGMRVTGAGYDDEIDAKFLMVTVVVDGKERSGRVYPDASVITRITPAEWPPQPGDLWRDRDGDLWFAQSDSGEPNMVGTTAWIESEASDYLARTRGPLTLVHREEASTG